ncbi:MAG: EAL domain-containing protein [Pseudomonadota bacterium]
MAALFVGDIADKMTRVKAALLALAISLLVCFPNLLSPLDLVSWSAQSMAGTNEISKKYVFVEAPDNVLDTQTGRDTLRNSLRTLSANGARKVFLDLSSHGTGEELPDNQLRVQIERDDRVFLVGRIFKDGFEDVAKFPPHSLVGGKRRVLASYEKDILGNIWEVKDQLEYDGKNYTSLASELSPDVRGADGTVAIDYRFDATEIPFVSLEELEEQIDAGLKVDDVSFVIGFAASSNHGSLRLPGEPQVPSSFISILAAETVAVGGLSKIGVYPYDYAPLLGFCFIFTFAGIVLGGRALLLGYTVCVLGVLFALIAPVFMPFRTGVSGGIFFVVVYAIISGIRRWRSNIHDRSSHFGLPSIVKLERDLGLLPDGERFALICVKLHNYSDLMATVGNQRKDAYFDAVVKRLQVTDPELTVYSNSGDRLFVLQEFESEDVLRSHLLALSSIFRTPLRLGEAVFDVAATFGVDLNYAGDPDKRINHAEALVAKTNLSSEPFVLGREVDTEDSGWRLSLQSKIDAALKSGEIYPTFQPQFDLKSGEIVGFEALVRWKDPQIGFVSPAYFIEQCEQAGRVDALQEFMLKECVKAFQQSNAMGTAAYLSVNVSAVLLSNHWIAELVANVLDESGFPPERLILEITETARINDHLTAVAVLSAIHSLGVSLSLDDFGTGTAGLETFLKLPFSELKVDRVFTQNIAHDQKARAVMEVALGLGQKLGVRVIVEGIETEQQKEILCELGFRYGQGFLFARPEREINLYEIAEFQRLRLA